MQELNTNNNDAKSKIPIYAKMTAPTSKINNNYNNNKSSKLTSMRNDMVLKQQSKQQSNQFQQQLDNNKLLKQTNTGNNNNANINETLKPKSKLYKYFFLIFRILSVQFSTLFRLAYFSLIIFFFFFLAIIIVQLYK